MISSTSSTNIQFTDHDVDTALESLGLTRSMLTQGISRGARDARSCTAFDPPTLAGQLRQGRTIRALREELVPLGWVSKTENGLSIVENPTASIAIAVSSGDEMTARIDGTPHTKYPKGNSTLKAVTTNRQPSLFGDDPAGEVDREFWVLLVASAGGRVVAELSRPRETVKLKSGKVKVVTWWDRLVLGEIETDKQVAPELLEDTGDHIAIEIRKK